jgi:anthranilate synthase component 2
VIDLQQRLIPTFALQANLLMAILILDNYDSFTYNLYDYIASLGHAVEVIRNDALDFNSLEQYSHIVLSPGPGLPQNAGCLMSIISSQIGRKPILGVCLGMQALALHLGDDLYNLEQVRHGREMTCRQLKSNILLSGADELFTVGLYHSWAILGKSKNFDITSVSADNVIMSLENLDLKCFGVQFHPESIMTPHGKLILQNFINFEG